MTRTRLSNKLRPQKTNTNLKKKQRKKQAIDSQNPMDLELEMDYQVPEKLEISKNDLSLFEQLTNTIEQEKARRKISEQLDRFDQEAVKQDPS